MTDGIPPQINLRAFREALGLTLDDLAERISEQGVTVTKFALSNVETGKRRASNQLMDAWARALNVRPIHIRQDRELCDLVRAWDKDREDHHAEVGAAA